MRLFLFSSGANPKLPRRLTSALILAFNGQLNPTLGRQSALRVAAGDRIPVSPAFPSPAALPNPATVRG